VIILAEKRLDTMAKKPEKIDTLTLLQKIGVSVKEGKNIGIYGPSMIGKSVLAAMIGRDFVGENGTVIIFGTESHFADEDYRKMISQFLPKNHYINVCLKPQDVQRFLELVERKTFEGRVAMILDSLSAIAMRMTSELIARGVTEPRVFSAHVVPTTGSIANRFKDIVVEKRALGIMIMHAGSMAGAGRYRGLTDLRPVMSRRVAHLLDYELQMTSEGATLLSPRRLMVTASRLTPFDEGREIKFRFSGDKIEIVEAEER